MEKTDVLVTHLSTGSHVEWRCSWDIAFILLFLLPAGVFLSEEQRLKVLSVRISTCQQKPGLTSEGDTGNIQVSFSHTHTHTPSLSHTHTFSLSHTHTPSLTHTHTLFLTHRVEWVLTSGDEQGGEFDRAPSGSDVQGGGAVVGADRKSVV